MLNNWHREIFIREYDKESVNSIIIGIVAEYLTYRNITPTNEQREFIIRLMIDELRSNTYAYAKPCMVRWALRRFDDPRNNNISAGVIFEYIRLGYKSYEYQQLVNGYLESKNNQVEEKSLSVRNLEAMQFCWLKCIESVKYNKVDLTEYFWASACRFLAIELKYLPSDEIKNKCHDQALKQSHAEIKRDAMNLQLKGQRNESKSMMRSLDDANFGNSNSVKLLRRKLVTLDYIKRNIGELSKSLDIVINE